MAQFQISAGMKSSPSDGIPRQCQSGYIDINKDWSPGMYPTSFPLLHTPVLRGKLVINSSGTCHHVTLRKRSTCPQRACAL